MFSSLACRFTRGCHSKTYHTILRAATRVTVQNCLWQVGTLLNCQLPSDHDKNPLQLCDFFVDSNMSLSKVLIGMITPLFRECMPPDNQIDCESAGMVLTRVWRIGHGNQQHVLSIVQSMGHSPLCSRARLHICPRSSHHGRLYNHMDWTVVLDRWTWYFHP